MNTNDFVIEGTTLVKYNGCDENVVVPEGITNVGDGAFSKCGYLTSITMPDGITTIGESAFEECHNLTSIIIPKGVTIIANWTFYNCKNLKYVEFPDGLTHIGKSAFCGCKMLRHIGLPESISRIDIFAFAYCEKLESVVIPNVVEYLSPETFEGCNNIKYLIIPRNLYIEGFVPLKIPKTCQILRIKARRKVKSKEKIEAKDSTQEGVTFDSFAERFAQAETTLYHGDIVDATVVEIRSDEVVLGLMPGYSSRNDKTGFDWGFIYFGQLSLSELSDNPHAKVADLVKLGEEIKVYVDVVCDIDGGKVYLSRKKLIEIEHWNNMEKAYENKEILEGKIIHRVRGGVIALVNETRVFIPTEYVALSYVHDLDTLINTTVKIKLIDIAKRKKIFIGALCDVFEDGKENCNVLEANNYEKNLSAVNLDDFVIGGTTLVEYKGKDASVLIPDCITIIDDYAFESCYSLWDVIIPKGVKHIGESAFVDCDVLRRIVIAEGVTSIGDHAFSNCENLRSIVLPNSITSIGKKVFSGCYSLECIVISKEIDVSAAGIPKKCKIVTKKVTQSCAIEGTTLVKYSGDDKSVIIPDGITIIEDHAFSCCESLISVVIPDSVTSIGNDAFAVCKNLISVVLPKGLTRIGECAFHYCKDLISITIPEGVTSIEKETFLGCWNLINIVLPNSVTSIGDGAFAECKRLTSITIPDRVTNIGKDTFFNCYSLKSITIPEGLDVSKSGIPNACEVIVKKAEPVFKNNSNCKTNDDDFVIDEVVPSENEGTNENVDMVDNIATQNNDTEDIESFLNQFLDN